MNLTEGIVGVNVRCPNQSCQKHSSVNSETVYCPFCGSKYSDLGVDIPKLIELEQERKSKADKFYTKWVFNVPIAASLIQLFTFIGLSFFVYAPSEPMPQWLAISIVASSVLIVLYFFIAGLSVVPNLIKKKYPRSFEVA